MSLDGFIAGPNESLDNGLGDGGHRLHEWFMTGGDASISRPSAVRAASTARSSTSSCRPARSSRAGGPSSRPAAGAATTTTACRSSSSLATSRGIDISQWPLVTYVSDVTTAMTQAKEAAGTRTCWSTAPGVARLALAAGVLDEIELHVVPVLFGQGRRLFEGLLCRADRARAHADSRGENGVTHMHYRVATPDEAKGRDMGKTIMGAVVSLDGFMADDNDGVGPLFDWLGNGDVAWSFPGSDDQARTTQASADFMLDLYGDMAANVIGRRVFDMTNGWNGKPAAGEHVFVVTHRPPTDWEYADTAPFTFVDGVEKAITAAKEFAGDRVVDVAAGQIGGQALKLGLIDQVVVNQVPVVFGSGRPFFATGGLAEPLLLENPTTVVQGDRVTHLVYDVSR